MPKLSGIVGGILGDLAESHTMSDARTRQVIESYRNDDVLRQFPVPRVMVRQATLRLRFAIVDTVPPPTPEESPHQYQALWARTMKERVLPQVLESIHKDDNRAVVAALRTRLAKPGFAGRVELPLLLDGAGDAELVRRSVEVIGEEFAALPRTIARQLPSREAVDAAVRDVVAREIPEARRAARALREANLAGQIDLDVSVRSEQLQALNPAQVSELELTLSMDEVRSAEAKSS